MTLHRSFPWLFIVTILSLALIGGSGCTESQDADSQEKIGAILPLTGEASSYGESCRRGMQVASDKFNVSIIYEDSRAEATTAVNAFKKLVNTNGVEIVVGGMFSAPTQAFAPIAQERGILVLSPTSGSRKVPRTGEYIFSLYPAAPEQGAHMAEYVQEESPTSNVAVIHAQEQVYADIAKGFASAIEEADEESQIVLKRSIPPDTRDFKNVISSLKDNGGADSVFLSGSKSFVANFISQAKSLGYNVRFYSQSTLYDKNLLSDYGQSLEGVTFTGPYFSPNVQSRGVSSFVSTFKERFKSTPDVWAAYCYDSVMAIKRMLRSCQDCDVSTRSDTLRTLNFDGLTGPISFKESGGALGSFRIFKVVDGQFQVVDK